MAMKHKKTNIFKNSAFFLSSAVLAALATGARADSFTDVSATGAWNTARWNNSTDGPAYTSTYTAGNAVQFTSGNYSFAGMGASINVGDVTLADGVTVNFATIGSTYGTGGNVRTITVGTGSLFNLNGNSMSTAAGTGFIKNGAGAWALSGSNYTGGFTLNNGTIIAQGVNAMGNGGTLTINGGAIGANATRNFSGKYTAVTIGGDFQLGVLSSAVFIASDSANLTFDAGMALGTTRKITIGGTGIYSLNGAISAGTLTVDALSGASAGALSLGGGSNTFSAIDISGGRLYAAATGALGAGAVKLDGTDTQLRLSATGVSLGNALTIGDTGNNKTLAGFATGGSTIYSGDITINETTAGNFTVQTGDSHTLTISGDIGGTGGAGLKKTSAGTVTLSGTNSYTGPNVINQGVINANSSTALGNAGNTLTITNLNTGVGSTTTLNVNASLTAGTLASTAMSTPSSGTNAMKIDIGSGNTLTVNQTADAAYAGEISGSGDLTLGSSSTHKLTLSASSIYTGATSINGGTLVMGDAAADSFATSGVSVAAGATLAGNGTINGTVDVNNSGTLAVGDNGVGKLTMNGKLTLNAGSTFKWELAADSTSDRGTNYDWVQSTAASNGLTISGSAIFQVIQTGTTDFTTAFWDSDRSWGDIFEATGSISGWNNTAVSVYNTSGGLLDVSDQGYFTISSRTLSWTAVPEPSTATFAGLVLAAGLLRRRR